METEPKNPKKYTIPFSIRVLVLFIFMLFLAFSIAHSKVYFSIGASILVLLSFFDLKKSIVRRFTAMDDFLESIKYKDFSRNYSETKGTDEMKNLFKKFNDVNRTIKNINTEKERQYLYLQKILKLVDVGIIAYNLETGDVLWSNESIKKILDFPSFKNIDFVAKRNPILYRTIFETRHSDANSVTLQVNNETFQVLLSDTIFEIEEQSFKLVLLQNIDETLNRKEAEAWKKLLSVMTHEIMNSIAPISSLAETLHSQLNTNSTKNRLHLTDLEDFNAGLLSIKRRSEGLLKFAKTYRSLNKVTQLNLEKIYVQKLFDHIRNLMQASLKEKNIEVDFMLENPKSQIEIDPYLIEQVLINLLLNAIDSCANEREGKIEFASKTDINGLHIIQIKDNGKGIRPEIMDRIFVPFFSTKKTGSGIGLSLCKQIMIMHQGKIHVQSEFGKGTLIRLLFK